MSELTPEKVIEHAKKSGFDSELKAEFILRNSKWNSNQSVYYVDKDEGKGRELDIYSYRIFSFAGDEPEVNIHINFCIEVKKSSDPFIFFSNDKKKIERGMGYGMLHWKNRVDRFVLSYEDIERKRPLRSNKRIARSYANFNDGKTAKIQSAVLSSFKGAIHYQEKCNEEYSDYSRDICLFIPMVVVEGKIFDCFFIDNLEKIQAIEVNDILYMQNYLSNNYGVCSNLVYIVTMDRFESLLNEMAIWGKDILNSMKKNRNKYKGR